MLLRILFYGCGMKLIYGRGLYSRTMADITNVLNGIWPFLGFLHILLVKFVSADYCEFGLCENEQYCCGDNKCCTKTLDLWFFWAGILLVVFALAVAAGVRYTKNPHPNYTKVTTQPLEETEAMSLAFK